MFGICSSLAESGLSVKTSAHIYTLKSSTIDCSVTTSGSPISSLALASVDAASAGTLVFGERKVQELRFSFSKDAEVHTVDLSLPCPNLPPSRGIGPTH